MGMGTTSIDDDWDNLDFAMLDVAPAEELELDITVEEEAPESDQAPTLRMVRAAKPLDEYVVDYDGDTAVRQILPRTGRLPEIREACRRNRVSAQLLNPATLELEGSVTSTGRVASIGRKS